MKFTNTQKLVYISILTALQVVLARFAGIKTPVVAISFSFMPLVITAVMFGSVPAMISAAAADVLGAVLFPVGAFFPGFTLSAALTGLLYGICLYNKPKKLWRIMLACFLINGLISLGLSTYWIHMISGRGMLALLPVRLMQNAVMYPLQVIGIWGIVYRIAEMAQKGRAMKNYRSRFTAAPRNRTRQ